MTADTQTRLAVMHEVARAKVAKAAGADGFWREVFANLDLIATAKVSGMAPVNENLLGLAMMLRREVERLRVAR